MTDYNYKKKGLIRRLKDRLTEKETVDVNQKGQITRFR